jgi:RimJ/RimL family protein N-acetyltransferase
VADGGSLTLRRALPADVDFLAGLYADEDVRPFLAAAGRYDADGIRAQVEGDPNGGGLVVFELDGEPAGAMAWTLANERSRIARLGGLAVHPDFRGRRLADDAARLLQRHLLVDRGLHRLELEVYAFNERGLRHAERAGVVLEGVKRRAYLRDGAWVDSVMFALVAEDLSAL